MGGGSIPQVGNGSFVPVMRAPILTLAWTYSTMGPSYFSFSFPTRAIDKEGRSTLSRTLSHGIRRAAQSLGIVSGSTPAPCFSSFLPLISLNSGAPDSSTSTSTLLGGPFHIPRANPPAKASAGADALSTLSGSVLYPAPASYITHPGIPPSRSHPDPASPSTEPPTSKRPPSRPVQILCASREPDTIRHRSQHTPSQPWITTREVAVETRPATL